MPLINQIFLIEKNIFLIGTCYNNDVIIGFSSGTYVYRSQESLKQMERTHHTLQLTRQLSTKYLIIRLAVVIIWLLVLIVGRPTPAFFPVERLNVLFRHNTKWLSLFC